MIAPGSEIVGCRVFVCACGSRRVARGWDDGALGRWKAAHEARRHGGYPVAGRYRVLALWVVRPPIGRTAVAG